MKPTANLPDVKTFSCPALVFFLQEQPKLKLIQESLVLNSQNSISHYALGQFYLNQGKLEEFVQEMKIAFKLRAEGK